MIVNCTTCMCFNSHIITLNTLVGKHDSHSFDTHTRIYIGCRNRERTVFPWPRISRIEICHCSCKFIFSLFDISYICISFLWSLYVFTSLPASERASSPCPDRGESFAIMINRRREAGASCRDVFKYKR